MRIRVTGVIHRTTLDELPRSLPSDIGNIVVQKLAEYVDVGEPVIVNATLYSGFTIGCFRFQVAMSRDSIQPNSFVLMPWTLDKEQGQSVAILRHVVGLKIGNKKLYFIVTQWTDDQAVPQRVYRLYGNAKVHEASRLIVALDTDWKNTLYLQVSPIETVREARVIDFTDLRVSDAGIPHFLLGIFSP